MTTQTLVKKCLPQNPDIEVLLPNYKEPILSVNHGGFGWYGLMAYNEQGQLMCHECGEFWDSLAKHIHKHRMSSREYKAKYGLLQKTKLVSANESRRLSLAMLASPERIKIATELIRKVQEKSRGSHGEKIALEFQNMQDSCPAQVIRHLLDASKIYGPNVSITQADSFRPGLKHLIERRFGSINKAKQIAKLVTNQTGTAVFYTRQLILEDMCSFYSKYGLWPTRRDYNNGMMICTTTPIHRNGGILALRQEAMKLREEQEARRIRGEGIPQRANNIELENAGYARR